MDRIAYEEEIIKQLEDKTTYRNFCKFVEKYIQKESISEDERDFLIIKEYSIPVIYVLPKVHKNPQHPPGRPIIAGTNSITSNLSHFIDFHLQPFVVKTQSYLKDTRDVLNHIQDFKWEEDHFLVTADVTSLYTIIDHKDGIKAITEVLENSEFTGELKDMILEGISFILNNNYFDFQGTFYLQTKGTAMGTIFAPSYANLFMDFWERSKVWMGHDYGGNLVSWVCYIDDVLL